MSHTHAGLGQPLVSMSQQGMLRHFVKRSLTRAHRTGTSRARAGITLPARWNARDPKGAVWAVAMVKDEADIIEQTVRHLLGQGVDRVLVVDNGSTDGTRRLLARMAATDARVLVGIDEERGYYQAEKMSLLARYAWRHGASWVIPFDADEFWFADRGSLSDFLRFHPAAVLRADIFNVFPDGAGAWRMELEAHQMRKVAFRAHPLALLMIGNHWVSRSGDMHAGLHVAHFPWRSESQLTRKLRNGAAAFKDVEAKEEVGRHWREGGVSSDEMLHAKWASVTRGEPVAGLGWSPVGPFKDADPREWKEWQR